MNPVKQQYLREEVQYLLDNDFIEPSQSEWSSPCILVPKPDGTFRMCTDYRKVNSVTKTDTFPIPRIDDCIDNIGHAKYVTKFDLLNGSAKLRCNFLFHQRSKIKFLHFSFCLHFHLVCTLKYQNPSGIFV